MESDVYILCPERTAAAATAFLDAVMPRLEAADVDYPLPQFSDQPAEIINDVHEVLTRLENSPCEPYGLHWTSRGEGEPYNCMLFFTKDRAMIAGVVVRDEAVSDWLVRLASTVGGQHGYVTAEAPPPDTAAEFIECARTWPVPTLFKGELRVP
ncbi:MAG: hypothetical protein AAF721_39300 [Myxococcota bacterium]